MTIKQSNRIKRKTCARCGRHDCSLVMNRQRKLVCEKCFNLQLGRI
jgi:hypothetical protein